MFTPPGRKALCGKGFGCLTNKKHGFTLAEILISLLILGVIASLTIPSLIQNTHKKEEVVKLKKTLSVLNQAYATNYAMTGENLHLEGEYDDIYPEEAIKTMLKKYISVDSSYNGYGFRTTDGIVIFPADPAGNSECTGMECVNINGNGKCGAEVLVFTTSKTASSSYVSNWMGGGETGEGSWWGDTGSLGNINGVYGFICAADRCAPTEKTAAIMNSTDPTKSE